MPYTTEHKQRTRERIVESARELFNREGFVDVSIDQIMGHAGLTRGGFYNHFETKEDLFLEVIEDFGRCHPAARWEGVELDFTGEAATPMLPKGGRVDLSDQEIYDAVEFMVGESS